MDRSQTLVAVTFDYLDGSKLTLTGEAFVAWARRFEAGQAMLQRHEENRAPLPPAALPEQHPLEQMPPVTLRDIMDLFDAQQGDEEDA